MTVADIGAGSGYYVVRLSRAVGPEGRVYGEDIIPEYRERSQSGLALEAKLPGGFGQLSNVVELDTGRVAFADTRDKLFLAAAFRF